MLGLPVRLLYAFVHHLLLDAIFLLHCLFPILSFVLGCGLGLSKRPKNVSLPCFDNIRIQEFRAHSVILTLNRDFLSRLKDSWTCCRRAVLLCPKFNSCNNPRNNSSKDSEWDAPNFISEYSFSPGIFYTLSIIHSLLTQNFNFRKILRFCLTLFTFDSDC